jgi:kynurenine formamidase
VPVDLFDIADDTPITAETLEPYEGRIGAGTIALLCTGWGELRGFTDRYINHSPWLAESGARWLANRDVAGVAIDHFSIAGRGPAEKVMPAHTILLSAGTWIVEEAFLPRELLGNGNWYVVALPLRLRGASGAPTRMIAVDFGSAEGRTA